MNKTPSAWMLRRDGTAFPCQCHYYGNADPAEVEETLYAAEWLYDVTQSEETQRRCLDLIAAYGVALRPNRNLVRNLLLAIRERALCFPQPCFCGAARRGAFLCGPGPAAGAERRREPGLEQRISAGASGRTI